MTVYACWFVEARWSSFRRNASSSALLYLGTLHRRRSFASLELG